MDKEDQQNSFESKARFFQEYTAHRPHWELYEVYADAPAIIGLKQNPTQTGAALVMFSLFTGFRYFSIVLHQAKEGKLDDAMLGIMMEQKKGAIAGMRPSNPSRSVLFRSKSHSSNPIWG